MTLAYAAFDLDGTVLDPAGRVLDGVPRGVARLREHGIVPILVTGRSYASFERLALPPEFLALCDRYVLLDEGDVILDRVSGTLEYRAVLPTRTLPELLGLGCQDIAFQWRGRHYGTGRRAALAFGMAFALPRASVELCPPPLPVCEPTRVVVFGGTPTLVAGWDDPDVEVATIRGFGAAVFRPRAGGKVNGLTAHLARRFGEADLSRVIAFGDGENDAALLVRSAVGVAVDGCVPVSAAGASVRLDQPLARYLATLDPHRLVPRQIGSAV